MKNYIIAVLFCSGACSNAVQEQSRYDFQAEREAVAQARIDCQSTQPDAHGFFETWEGYRLKGKTYKGPCEALRAAGGTI